MLSFSFFHLNLFEKLNLNIIGFIDIININLVDGVNYTSLRLDVTIYF
jgi:hypothetical protein